ncbi:MAG: DUF2339 domain-containing protein [Hyphomicrobiales bacterium]|nr:DUF2339 domain-containing protein [Hyphomicrobiales bacterium]
MEGVFVLAGLFVFFIFFGSVAGFVAFFKLGKLRKEFDLVLAKTRNPFQNAEKAHAEEQSLKQDEQPDIVTDDLKSADRIIDDQIKADVDSHNAEQKPGDDEYESQRMDVDSSLVDQSDVQEETKPSRTFEETIGSLWAVWVGGLALALGAVFLVKFSIEQGLLSPGVRIALGLFFSGALVALGEWTRRRGDQYSFADFSKANIPAILTAAGTLGAFSSIYAAYELYDMLSPLVAFLGLAIVAIATTFAALLHGPLLAALGILASFGSPLLISTDSPSVPGLSFYILLVAASGFTVGRMRYWKWLAIAVSIGLMAYGFLIHNLVLFDAQGDRIILAFYLLAAWCMIAYVFVVSLYPKLKFELEPVDYVASALLGVMLVFMPAGSQVYPDDFVSVLILAIIVGGPFLLAIYYSASRVVVYASMAVSAIGYLSWSIDFGTLPALDDLYNVDVLLTSIQVREKLSMHAWVGVFLAALAAGTGFWGVRISSARAALAIGGAFLPILLFCVHYFRVAEFSSSWSYAFVALLMFVGNFALSNFVFARFDDNIIGRDNASAAYSVAAIVALALSVSLVLEKAALTIALALLVPAIAYVYHRRPLPALRPLTALATILWIGRVMWEPAIIEGDLGTTPIFNWLTYGYGIPTAGFALAAWFLGRGKRDKWLEGLEGITLASFVATIGLVSLHAIDPSEVFTEIDTLAEAALLTIIAAGVALGLLFIGRTQQSKALSNGVTILGYIGMISGGFGLLIVFNPWINHSEIGSGWIFNSLLYAYVLPGLLYLGLGWYATGRRPKAYTYSAFVLAALLLSAWINLTIRHIYHPFSLNTGGTSEAELYTYSIVWLVIGIALLAAGIIARYKPLRLASVGILVLVVAKVFLIDMAGLEGILRALSFIGLGATLIAIGIVYQRVLSKPDFSEEEPVSDENSQTDKA